MNQFRKLFILSLFLGFIFIGSTKTQVVAKAAENTTTASQAYANAMGPGWNLGNTFDSVDTNTSNPYWKDLGEQAWGNPIVTKELIHSIKEFGFKSIRMPFTCYTRTGDAPTYTIKADYLNRYAEVVNWALNEGLYVLIDAQHVDPSIWGHNIGSDDGTAMKKFKALWTQVADYFKDYSDKVCFESLNEPYYNGSDEEQIKINNEVNKAFYEVVRNSGGKNATRMLVFPNLKTNAGDAESKSSSETILNLNDKNIMATYHYYGYWPFSVNLAGYTTFDGQTLDDAKKSIDIMHNNFIQNGIGVICGEYGVLGDLSHIDHGEYLKYIEYITSYGKANGIGMIMWNNGRDIDRYNYTWGDKNAYDIIMTSANSLRSSYAASDRIFVTEKNRNADVSTKLTLNGNKLMSISDQNRQLVLGTDYTYENETVTFKGSYVNSIIANKYGINGTLNLKFSNGPDWKIDVTFNNKPISSDSTGTTDKLVIPMKFNGSILSTMEASYSNGSGAGPNNWTTYKEFGTTFSPNYDNNTLTITDKFFAECNDGTINLKFHWKNGDITEYVLNKSGKNVTGKAIGQNNPPVLLGDVNDDGQVSITDYLALKKYLTNSKYVINEKNSDINGDGKLNIVDLLELRNLI
ncbi:cellulase family glycosylhydrolase [Clostridium sp. SHJSY1]|uniref:cellulase family glycosylhydrolase n=1 Tax=Clostridium sp. SHJSY1 TaxID=2942483 RepID=UPI00287623B0|nr:cellulase family glycosylhydrolase [Clostridium sp. SHJSY1]MDS0527432.1 cellulase family glycosylhydrolase [Clostridium sp. SHJSY1]